MEDVNRDWMTEEEVGAFVGENAQYYKEKWKAHPKTDYYKGWNGVALFFFFEWAAYRKMYREVFLIFFGTLACSVLFSFIPILSNFWGELLGQAIKILLGAFANGLYRQKALRTVRQTVNMEGPQKTEYLAQKGGTSWVALLLFVVFELALVFLPLILPTIILNA